MESNKSNSASIVSDKSQNNHIKGCFIKITTSSILSQNQHFLTLSKDLDSNDQSKLILSHDKPELSWVINDQTEEITITDQKNQSKRQLSLIKQTQNTQKSTQTNQNNENLAGFFQSVQEHIDSDEYFTLKKNQRHLKQTLLQKTKLIKALQQQNQKLKKIILQQQNSIIQSQPDIQIPDPVLYAPIQFYDNQKLIRYTDCWEISVLRFLHLVFGYNGRINQNNLVKFMDQNNKNCQKLIQYFRTNPTYSFKQEFYTTQEGFKIRSQWAQFLNNSKLMKVKLQKKYQVAATIPNLISFFKGFFPKLRFNHLSSMNYEDILTKQLFQNYQKVLSQIYEQLSEAAGFNIKVKIHVKTQYSEEFIYFSAVQYIYLNDQNQKNPHPLQWQIYEYYYLTDKKRIGQRMMGHSDYRYNKNITKQKQDQRQMEQYEKQLNELKNKISSSSAKINQQMHNQSLNNTQNQQNM